MNHLTPRHGLNSPGNALLACGVVAGPLFIGLVLAQAATRPGFDLVRLPLSLLDLGGLGWIQRANFVIAGLLYLGCAAGIKRTLTVGRAARWGSRLVAIFGFGLMAAGLFPPDPALGFPPRTAQASPSGAQSWHSQVHGLAFDVAFLALIVLCFVMARRFHASGDRRWVAYCMSTGIITPLMIGVGFARPGVMGLLFLTAGALSMACLSAVPIRLMAEPKHRARDYSRSTRSHLFPRVVGSEPSISRGGAQYAPSPDGGR